MATVTQTATVSVHTLKMAAQGPLPASEETKPTGGDVSATSDAVTTEATTAPEATTAGATTTDANATPEAITTDATATANASTVSATSDGTLTANATADGNATVAEKVTTPDSTTTTSPSATTSASSKTTPSTKCATASTISLISRLSRLLTAPGGIDCALCGAQNFAPFAAAALLALAGAERRLLRAGIKHLRLHPQRLIDAAGGVNRAFLAILEARMVWRLFGLLPVLSNLLSLHPRPLAALRNALAHPSVKNLDLRNPRVFGTVHAFLMAGYYLFEHIAFFGSKGVLELKEGTVPKMFKWSKMCWMAQHVITSFKLIQERLALNARVCAAESSESVDAKLAADKRSWYIRAVQNIGWLPLSAQWAIGPLWTSPLLTAGLGNFINWYRLQGMLGAQPRTEAPFTGMRCWTPLPC